MSDIACVLCDRPCTSFGPFPVCERCTRKQAACLPPVAEPFPGVRRTGIEHMRIAVTVFNGCRESFNERFTPEQLLKLYRALLRSEWDIAPDRWTQGEIALALQGRGTGATSDR